MAEWMPLLERLEWALARAGITRSQLAHRLGVSRSAATQWGRETKQITPEHLFPAARVLGVEAEWLGTGHGPRTPAEAVAPSVLPPELADSLPLLRALMGLRPPVRAALVALLDAMDR